MLAGGLAGASFGEWELSALSIGAVFGFVLGYSFELAKLSAQEASRPSSPAAQPRRERLSVRFKIRSLMTLIAVVGLEASLIVAVTREMFPRGHAVWALILAFVGEIHVSCLVLIASLRFLFIVFKVERNWMILIAMGLEAGLIAAVALRKHPEPYPLFWVDGLTRVAAAHLLCVVVVFCGRYLFRTVKTTLSLFEATEVEPHRVSRTNLLSDRMADDSYPAK
jgi:hypothetical protein